MFAGADRRHREKYRKKKHKKNARGKRRTGGGARDI